MYESWKHFELRITFSLDVIKVINVAREIRSGPAGVAVYSRHVCIGVHLLGRRLSDTFGVPVP